jgi:hypothetical protein
MITRIIIIGIRSEPSVTPRQRVIEDHTNKHCTYYS